ncbi:MAG: hypothetical protein R3E94_14385 [Burkholderiaceae bacterium]
MPVYFNTTPVLEKRALPDFSTTEDEAMLARQQEAAAAFIEEKPALAARIESAFNDRYSSLLTVNDLFDPARHLDSTSPGLEPAATAEEVTTPPSATVVPLRAADGGASA